MKNLFKSIFIALFPMLALYVLIDSSLHLFQHDFSFRYLGRLVTALTIAILFAGLFIVSQARTSKNLNIYTVFIVFGFLISIVLGGVIENNDLIGSSMSFILVVCWIVYLKWYSVFEKRSNSILKIGNILPNFKLEDTDKNKVSNSSFLGNPTIYLFYRGNWCPLCMAQIKEIAAQYKELEQRGINMVLISPQPHGYSKNLAKKHNVGFTFLTDTQNNVAKQLNIFAKNGIPTGFQAFGYDSDTVLPTVIITDANGKIVFADLTDNYRVRPEPETFLKIIDALR
ncbi:MAG: redoxin domain-containing protein [Bacteroidetes bacterium]|nr:redoxin domain-containing protein [Bacteroidota bacterium]